MLYSLFSSVAAFIATNIDDMFINMLLFSSSKGKKDDFSIVMGKYFGTGALVVLSILGAYGAKTAIGRWVHLLGVIPVYLGIREICDNKKQQDKQEIAVSTGYLLSTALITIANGADNVGVYVPLFSGFSIQQLAVMTVVFIVMTGIWCILGKAVVKLSAVRNVLEKYSNIITPVVYIGLGVYILFF